MGWDQILNIPTKRVIAFSVKYCESEDPLLTIGQRISLNFMCSATILRMKVVDIDEYVEDGDTKKVYHFVDYTIKTQEDKTLASMKELRRKLKKDLLIKKKAESFEEEEVVEEPKVRRLVK